jgi:hypothetical protein
MRLQLATRGGAKHGPRQCAPAGWGANDTPDATRLAPPLAPRPLPCVPSDAPATSRRRKSPLATPYEEHASTQDKGMSGRTQHTAANGSTRQTMRRRPCAQMSTDAHMQYRAKPRGETGATGEKGQWHQGLARGVRGSTRKRPRSRWP